MFIKFHDVDVCLPSDDLRVYILLLHYLTFARYYIREDAENAIRYINGTRLDDRIVRTDWDAGFVEGRQYGRGRSGGQVGLNLIVMSYHFFHAFNPSVLVIFGHSFLFTARQHSLLC